MPPSLQNQIDLLYAEYTGQHSVISDDLVIHHRWPEIHQRATDGELTVKDWQDIRTMFQAVASTGRRNGEEWFQAISRRFGTANHSTVRRPPQQDIWGRSGITIAEGIDPLRLSALVYAYGLAPRATPMEISLARYMAVDPDLRTHFTDEMLVTEQVLGSILSLKPGDITPEVQEKLKKPVLRQYLERAFVDLKDLLFEHNTLTVLLYNTIMNGLYEGNGEINVYRVHINMTTLNELDSTNAMGNVYLGVVRGWFQEKFGSIHVVQNPERTTFQFIGRSPREVAAIMADYRTEIRTRIATAAGVDPSAIDRFVPQAVISTRRIHRGNLYAYAIRTEEDLEAFRAVIEFDGQHNVDQLKASGIKEAVATLGRTRPPIDRIKRSRNRTVIKTLNALMIKATFELNRQLAAQTTFFEKDGEGITGEPVDSKVWSTHTVYAEKDLPHVGTALHKKWLAHLAKEAGYVGPGQYNPSRDNPELAGAGLADDLPTVAGLHEGPVPDEDHDLNLTVRYYLRIIPRLGHIKGRISHERKDSEGGSLEQFQARMWALANARESEVPERLRRLQDSAERLKRDLLKVYRLAITDPRNTWTPKQHRLFPVHRGKGTEEVRANFFAQEVSVLGNTHLATLEYDSFSAFNNAHAHHDDIDTDYQRVRDAIFVAAKRLKMSMPIVNPSGGDHISISFSANNRNGNPVDPVKFCRLIQKIVYDEFRNRPFQDYHKVERDGDIVRLPMWKKIGGREGEADYFVFGKTRPEGYEPFMRTLTVSMALGRHERIRGAKDADYLVAVEDALGGALGEVKKQSWPHKGGVVDFRERCPRREDVRAHPSRKDSIRPAAGGPPDHTAVGGSVTIMHPVLARTGSGGPHGSGTKARIRRPAITAGGIGASPIVIGGENMGTLVFDGNTVRVANPVQATANRGTQRSRGTPTRRKPAPRTAVRQQQAQPWTKLPFGAVPTFPRSGLPPVFTGR